MLRFTVLVSLLGACASTPRSPSSLHDAPTPPASIVGVARSLDQGLAARQLARIEVTATRREMSFDLGAAPVAHGRTLVLTETAGWNAAHVVFARRADGAILLVRAQPRTIVEGRVAGGCIRFAGGRGWFERVEYTLPDGTYYAGAVDVPYEQHVTVTEYQDHEPDGSPCPPPAID